MAEEFKLGHSEEAEDISKTCAFFTDLSDVIRYQGARLDIDEERLFELAATTSIEMAKMYTYDMIYIPKKPLALLRQLQIFNAMRRGVPPEIVAREHKVTQQWVYRVYKDMQAKHVKRVQRELF